MQTEHGRERSATRDRWWRTSCSAEAALLGAVQNAHSPLLTLEGVCLWLGAWLLLGSRGVLHRGAGERAEKPPPVRVRGGAGEGREHVVTGLTVCFIS